MHGRHCRTRVLAAMLLVLGAARGGLAQPRTMGILLNTPDACDGYTLFEPLRYPETFLVDNQGYLIHSWPSDQVVGAMAYLLPNGHLLRASDSGDNDVFLGGGAGGTLREVDWDNVVQWEFNYSSETFRQHHDLTRLPNGNVLFIAWELRTPEEAIQAGRDPAFLGDAVWPEHIVEIHPDGASATIVWEWHVWDHLIQDFDPTKDNYGVVADHPELVDINYPGTAAADWLHFNAVDYNADLDQIAMSSPRFGEVWIIDHSTTTAEAAGHTGGARGKGGDLIYRWGNPQSYDRGAPEDQKLFFQHDTHWIPAGLPGEGHILVFNNGLGRPDGMYSSLEEIETPVEPDGSYPDPAPGEPYGPAETYWTYTSDPPGDFFSFFMSSAQRQPNGNTLVCMGASGEFLELNPNGDLVWEYVDPVGMDGPMMQGDPPTGNVTFRALRYPRDVTAAAGHDLTPLGTVELYPSGRGATDVAEALSGSPRLARALPNPFRGATNIVFSTAERTPARLDIYDIAGRHIATLLDGSVGPGEHRCTWDVPGMPGGVYVYSLRVGAERATGTMTLLR